MHISKEILEKLGVKTKETSNVPVTLHEAIQAEKKLEMEMIKKGIDRFHKSINKTKSKKNKKEKPRETTESVTVYGQQLAQEGLEPMNEAINDYFIKAFDGHAKKYATEAKVLSQCIPVKEIENNKPERWNAISFITLKAVLDSITVGSTQTKSILKIANSVEDEARLGYFREQDTKTYKQTKEWLKNNSKKNYRHNRKVYAYAMNKHELEWNGFSKEEKVKLGKLLLELLIKYTGFVTYTQKTIKNGKDYRVYKYVQVTPKTLEWIEKKKIHSEILKPFRLPMIIKPKQWSNPYDGGYYIKELRPKELGATLGELTKQPMQKEEKNALQSS